MENKKNYKKRTELINKQTDEIGGVLKVLKKLK